MFVDHSSAFKELIFKRSCCFNLLSVLNKHKTSTFWWLEKVISKFITIVFWKRDIWICWLVSELSKMFQYFAVIFFISISLTVQASQARHIGKDNALRAEVFKNFITRTSLSLGRIPNPICKDLWRCFRRGSKTFCYKVSKCTI